MLVARGFCLASGIGRATLAVAPDHRILRIEAELGREAVDQLVKLIVADQLFRREYPVADGVLTAEPECVVAGVLEVTHVATQQLDPLVVLAVGEVSQRALKRRPPCFDPLALDDHLRSAR